MRAPGPRSRVGAAPRGRACLRRRPVPCWLAMLLAPSRWVLPVVLCLGAGCDDADTGARERREKELQERLLEIDARLAKHEARLARLETPPASDPDAAERRTLTLDVGSDGLRLDGAAVEQTRLAQLLRERVAEAKPTELALTVRPAPEVPYARVIEIFDVARTAGVTQVAMAPTR